MKNADQSTYSCDNFAVSSAFSDTNNNLHAKNSDRPLGEAQVLRYYPAENYAGNQMVHCTHLCIPQVAHTYAVLGSQPYWMWGFEMGVNEYGVSIGNEAQGSRCESESAEGLLGMDILRLALERSMTARQAVDVITSLLEKYGQNANASILFERRYENSYLIMDRNEILVLETAGRQWAVRKAQDWTSISNCYSISSDYIIGSKDLEQLARKNRWLRDDEKFDFSKAYTLPCDRQRNALPRWRRMNKLLSMQQTPLSIQDAKKICRDHFEGEINDSRFGVFLGTFFTICMHAETLSNPQTVASMITTYDDELGIVCRFASGIPCCSVYIPVYFGASVPVLETAGGKYDSESLWWVMERLAMAVSVDEGRFAAITQERLWALEAQLEEEAQRVERIAKDLKHAGRLDDAQDILFSFTRRSAQTVLDLAKELTEEICRTLRKDGGLYGPRKAFLEEYCAKTGILLR